MSWFQKSKRCMHIAICAAAENQPEKNLVAAEFFYLRGFFAGRIFFQRIFGGSKFFGDGGQIRRLRGLVIIIIVFSSSLVVTVFELGRTICCFAAEMSWGTEFRFLYGNCPFSCNTVQNTLCRKINAQIARGDIFVKS